ncbi:MAG: hypothetical protein WKF86_07485 [Acidimicrobiales bacterium]
MNTAFADDWRRTYTTYDVRRLAAQRRPARLVSILVRAGGIPAAAAMAPKLHALISAATPPGFASPAAATAMPARRSRAEPPAGPTPYDIFGKPSNQWSLDGR